MKKISLITGSTQGMGFSIAETLGASGHKVIISSRKEENSYKAEDILKKKNIDYDYFMCNFDVREQRKKLFDHISKKYGRIDNLVCAVSSNPYLGDSLSINEKEFDKIFETNVKNTFFTIIDFLPLLKASPQSNVVITSSHSGYIPFPFLGIVSISKTALFAMAKILAKELAEFNIRVNCVAPGLVKTRMTSSVIYNTMMIKQTYLNRNSMPHEMAATVAFLCSNDSSFINGETISVNGGMAGRL